MYTHFRTIADRSAHHTPPQDHSGHRTRRHSSCNRRRNILPNLIDFMRINTPSLQPPVDVAPMERSSPRSRQCLLRLSPVSRYPSCLRATRQTWPARGGVLLFPQLKPSEMAKHIHSGWDINNQQPFLLCCPETHRASSDQIQFRYHLQCSRRQIYSGRHLVNRFFCPSGTVFPGTPTTPEPITSWAGCPGIV